MSCGNFNYGTNAPKNAFRIIQGDTFQRTMTIRLTGGDKLDGSVITRVMFSCDKLDIHDREIPPKTDLAGKVMPGLYRLSFTSDETASFEKGSFTYDITIEFGKVGSAVIKTVRYQYPLEILPKNNWVNWNSNNS